MKQKFNWKPILPHAISIAVFFVILAIYFSPAMEGKVMKSHDVQMANGMQKEINTYKQNGEYILWTNTIFGGMPSYQIWMRSPNNVITYIIGRAKLGFLPRPMGNFFLYFIGFYIFLCILKIRPEFAFLGGLAFAFSSYNLINIEAGHITKGLAMAFAPMVLGGVILLLRKKYITGLFLTTLALGLEVGANHYQITYYLFIMIFILLILEFVQVVKKKDYIDFIKSGALMLMALVLAVGMNITSIWVTQDYLSYSTRGQEEVVEKSDKTDAKDKVSAKEKKGLDFGYAMGWSYGVSESFTLLIPNFRGGGTGASVPDNKDLEQIYKNIVQEQVQKGTVKREAEKNARMQVSGLLYWGKLGTTSGPIYLGAVIIFLFVFGSFLIKGKMKWWILITSLLALMLAWGKNFEPLSKLFYFYFPMYNKFRAPMTLLLLLSITVPLMGTMIMDRIAKKEYEKADILRALKYTVFSIGGLLLFIGIFSGSIFNFEASHDSSLGNVIDIFRDQRKKMLVADTFRSLVLILLAAGFIYLFVVDKIKKVVLVGALGVLILIDIWGVDFRYLNKDDFYKERKRNNKNLVQERPVDLAIERLDKDPHYRVMDMTVNVWNDASAANYHKIIGGYHAAKMRRYQELIEKQFTPQLNRMIEKLNNGEQPTPELTPVFNMMNTKYFIFSPQANGVIPNPYALGNAWFVDNVKFVEKRAEEVKALGVIDPGKTAVINTNDYFYKDEMAGVKMNHDEGAEIYLESYHPEHMKYISKSASDELAVFSEIFYDKGWNAYIDNKLVPYFRVNYILRALKVPAGEHEIEFKFEPRSYYTGEKIALASSILFILIFLGAVFYHFRQADKKPETIEE